MLYATIFGLLAIFMVYTVWRKRRDFAERYREEADEERWAESLTDADIEEIYGPEEDER